jgi:hypothetical protein
MLLSSVCWFRPASVSLRNENPTENRTSNKNLERGTWNEEPGTGSGYAARNRSLCVPRQSRTADAIVPTIARTTKPVTMI